MVDPSDFLKGLKNPHRAAFEIYKIIDQEILGNQPVSVMERDWDNLVILDACRDDIFRQQSTLSGTLTTVTSAATQTLGFLKENFGSGEFPETVYVSANPNIQLVEARFHDRIRLWESDWDNDLAVTPPTSVTTAALEAEQKYPDKRLIIHYMQPHYPFIGETGLAMRDQGTISYDFKHGDDFWNQLSDQNVDSDQFLKAYEENLDIVLAELPHLCGKLNRKTVITSDHGNEFGRLGVYGHPRTAYTRGLVRVPWLEKESAERKEITPGEATEGPQRDYDITKERLVMLGYKSKID